MIADEYWARREANLKKIDQYRNASNRLFVIFIFLVIAAVGMSIEISVWFLFLLIPSFIISGFSFDAFIDGRIAIDEDGKWAKQNYRSEFTKGIESLKK